jgi:hypothetical protein
MNKVEIDGDTADRIVACSLKESILMLRGDIKKLRNKKRLSDWEKMCLAEAFSSLDHLEKTFDYYGGKLNE